MEHVDESSGVLSPAEASQAPAVIAKLDSANRRLRDSKARFHAATALNRLLATAAKGLDEPDQKGAVAESLLSLLDDPVFKKATDPNGNSCRVAAVGAMLELGYPAALQVHPDDLMFYRQRTLRSSAWPAVLVSTVAAVVLILLGVMLVRSFSRSSEFNPPRSPPSMQRSAPLPPSARPVKPVTSPPTFRLEGVDIENKTDDVALIVDTIEHDELDTAMLLLAQAETPDKRLAQLPLEIIVFHLRGDSKNADIAYEQLKLSRPNEPSLPGLARLLSK